MSTKTQLLAALEQAHGEWINGGVLAQELGVSRTAVWKAVNTLKAGGYHIESVTGKGYRLGDGNDILSVQGIAAHLDDPARARGIILLKETDSTNSEAKRRAFAGAAHGTVVIAERQTGGRGRRGRTFFSPPGGVYLSVVLRPDLPAEDCVLVTTATCVAVCRAVYDVTGENAQIKWVNDVLLRGKKICGILTEAVMDVESGAVDSVVVGMGVNLFVPPQAFPPELREVAGSVLEQPNPAITRNCLAARLIYHMDTMEQMIRTREFIADYKARSIILGKEITVFTPVASYDARAVSIDKNGGLVVRKADGQMAVLRSGEVTIRPKEPSA